MRTSVPSTCPAATSSFDLFSRLQAGRRSTAEPPTNETAIECLQVMKYLIIIEKARSGYSAYAPDVPGCVATGATRAQTERAMRKAMAMHLDELRAGGEKLP